MRKHIKTILQTLIIILIFFYLIRYLIINWTKIPFDEIHLNLLFLLISFLVLTPHFLSYGKSWQAIMKVLGNSISFAQSIWIISTTQIAKYLPGRVWYMLGRIYVGKQEKMDGKIVAVSVILETCLLITTGGILYLLSVISMGKFNVTNIIICTVLIIVAISGSNPKLLSWGTNIILKILKKEVIKLNISYSHLFQISLWFFGLWIAQVIGFYFLVTSIYLIPFAKIIDLTAAYTLSWIIGFIVIFAPGGLGVREGIMSLLLSSFIPTPLAIAISFLSRVWITVFEIVVFFIGLTVHKFSRKNNS